MTLYSAFSAYFIHFAYNVQFTFFIGKYYLFMHSQIKTSLNFIRAIAVWPTLDPVNILIKLSWPSNLYVKNKSPDFINSSGKSILKYSYFFHSWPVISFTISILEFN